METTDVAAGLVDQAGPRENHQFHWMRRLWTSAKRWRHIPLGPVSLTFKFQRRPAQGEFVDTAYAVRQTSAGQTAHAHFHHEHARIAPAIVVGVGPGCGYAAANLLVRRGIPVALVSRSAAALRAFAQTISSADTRAHSYPCDATDERDVIATVARIQEELGTPQLLIYAVQSSTSGSVLDTEAAAFEECWRANCFGAFLFAREVAKTMVRKRLGTIIFAGATSAVIGRKGYVSFAPGKFGLRALAQVMARELWSQGVHVTHVLIDGDIADSTPTSEIPQIDPLDLAEIFLALHLQPKTCWSSELDVRPSNESFWQHC